MSLTSVNIIHLVCLMCLMWWMLIPSWLLTQLKFSVRLVAHKHSLELSSHFEWKRYDDRATCRLFRWEAIVLYFWNGLYLQTLRFLPTIGKGLMFYQLIFAFVQYLLFLTEFIEATVTCNQNTAPFNLTGHPAISLPVGSVSPDDVSVTTDGLIFPKIFPMCSCTDSMRCCLQEKSSSRLPVGLQIIGKHFEEREVLDVAFGIERLSS